MRKTTIGLSFGFALLAAALPLASLAFRPDDTASGRPQAIDLIVVTAGAPQEAAAGLAAIPCAGHETSDSAQS